MPWPTRIWLILAAIWIAFFAWYTSFAGPLTQEEIAHYTEVLRKAGATPERLEKWRAFMESDTGDDFAMINVIDFNDVPTPGPGIEPGETSAEVMAKYSEPFLGRALRNAGHPVMIGTAAADALDIWGVDGVEDADDWSMGGLVRYRSRRDVLEQAVMLQSADQNIHDFKIAAIEKTIAYPLDPWFQLGDPRLVLGMLLLIIGLSCQLWLGRAR